MKEIIILIGSGRSGKTTYAKKIVEEKGQEYMSVDDNFNYGEKHEGYMKFIDFVAKKLNENPDKDFVLDGYCNYDSNFEVLKNKLKTHRIRPIVVYAKPEVIMERIEKDVDKKRKKRVEIKDVKELYTAGIGNSWDLSEFEFIDSSDGFKETSYSEMMKQLITKEDVKEVVARNASRKHDPLYQTIELPFDMIIQGYNANFEHGSWNRISEIYDFEDKKVADFCCHNGYFCYKIKEKGSKIVHGFDVAKDAIETSKEIARVKGLIIKFEVLDIDLEEIEDYDVSLLLNTSHHLKNVAGSLNKIFSKSKAVILEMQFTNISREKVFEIAEQYNHKLNKEVASARPNRVIMLFKK